MNILIIIAIAYILYRKYKSYINTSYNKITKNNFVKVWLDKGLYGEYLIYKKLQQFEKKNGKFLFNIYLPKESGETTEIDVLLITAKGLFVFESKNYSGWIFGSETQKNWTQTLPKGIGKSQKEYFYNPILQNKGHINALKKILKQNVPIYSIITFSERCTLKKLPANTEFVKIIKRNNVSKVVSEIYEKSKSIYKIEDIYNTLKKYALVDDKVKRAHINKVREYRKINRI